MVGAPLLAGEDLGVGVVAAHALARTATRIATAATFARE
jgi:hypothetical protein